MSLFVEQAEEVRDFLVEFLKNMRKVTRAIRKIVTAPGSGNLSGGLGDPSVGLGGSGNMESTGGSFGLPSDGTSGGGGGGGF